MRWLVALGALTALAFAQNAAADPVSVAPVSFSPAFETSLQEKLGPREGAFLQQQVTNAVSAALHRAGAETASGGPVTIETTIVDADPNRPTMQQLIATPGLDPIRSVSIGGAELTAVIRSADGHTLAEVNHRQYSMSLADVVGQPDEWYDARRAIRGFANKVARAYVAAAH